MPASTNKEDGTRLTELGHTRDEVLGYYERLLGSSSKIHPIDTSRVQPFVSSVQSMLFFIWLN